MSSNSKQKPLCQLATTSTAKGQRIRKQQENDKSGFESDAVD